MNNIYRGYIQEKEMLIIAKFVQKNKYKGFCSLAWGGTEDYSKVKENYA